jgi:hypothetical protein
MIRTFDEKQNVSSIIFEDNYNFVEFKRDKNGKLIWRKWKGGNKIYY